MTHISTRRPGTICYRCDDHMEWAYVEAVVVSCGVFIASVLATSSDGVKFTEVEEERDIMRQVSDLVWYESGRTGDPVE